MRNDDTPLLNQETVAPPMALLPLGERRNGDWSGSPALMQPAAPAPGAPDIMVYVHAIRRYWLMAAGIGLLCGAAVGPAVWFGIGPRYTASSLLSVSMQEKSIAFNMDSSGATDKDRFEIYKSTQTQLLTSRFVLMAALRNPQVLKLPIIKREQEKRDPVVWLQHNVGVGFPGKAELMEVSMSREDPDEATILVRKVVQAYLNEVVNNEGDKKARASERGRQGVQ